MGKTLRIETAWEGSFVSAEGYHKVQWCSVKARNCITVLLIGLWYTAVLVGNTGPVSLLKLPGLWGVTCSLSFPPDEAAAGSLPLVSVSLFTPLTPAEMAPYMKRLSRGQTVEGKWGPAELYKDAGQMQAYANPVTYLSATG